MSYIFPANRLKNIKYSVMDTIAKAHDAEKKGMSLNYLHIGDPLMFDFKTPAHVVESATRAMRDNKTGYTETSGIPEAIDAIRRYAEEVRGIRNITDIFVTNGVSEAIDLCIGALVNEGENVLLPNPSYPLYITSLFKHSASPVFYDLDESRDWQPDIEDIKAKINGKTRAIVLINPNNPTGSVCERSTIEELIQIAVENDLIIFSDEIYDNLILDDIDHVSPASLTDSLPIVTFNGLSKSYLVPGFRIGWCIVSGGEKNTRDYCEAIATYTRARLCANHPEQYAIKPALEGDQTHIADMVNKLRERRDITVRRLEAIEGISCISPKAAFYAFPKLDIGVDDIDFVHGLISEKGVVTVYGSAFGPKRDADYFRVVYLDTEERLNQAFDLMAEFAGQLESVH